MRTYTDNVFTRPRPHLGESLRHLLELRLLPRSNKYSSSILDQRRRHHLPETTPSTRDNGDLALDAEEVLDGEVLHFLLSFGVRGYSKRAGGGRLLLGEGEAVRVKKRGGRKKERSERNSQSGTKWSRAGNAKLLAIPNSPSVSTLGRDHQKDDGELRIKSFDFEHSGCKIISTTTTSQQLRMI